ncbi:MAG: DHHA1 domain-containing protein [Nanoarchaeota archaeon]|nr:DHHA1 domain-containing protein [Nanoarchaeota archaeon]
MAIPEKLYTQIREAIEGAARPLIFFDDDPDGLSSYLILKKHYGKGKGIPMRRNDENIQEYVQNVEAYGPDLVITLDKATITQDFVDQIKVPMIIVDHHAPNQIQGALYLNPQIYDKKDNRPTSYWSWQITKEDPKTAWIAAIGITGDYHLLDAHFLKTFAYPELYGTPKNPNEALFEQPIGTLVKIFICTLKGKTADLQRYLSYLENINDPNEILQQTTPEGKKIWQKYERIIKEYDGLLTLALKSEDDGTLFIFKCPAVETSFTSPLSNEILYRVKSKYIIIARSTNDRIMMSLRSKAEPIRPVLLKILPQLPGAYGGGHDMACGANIPASEYDHFITLIKKELYT